MLNKKGQTDLIQKLEKVEKKIFDVKKSNALPVISILIGFFLALSLLAVIFYQFYQFVDQNRIIMQSPITVEFRSLVVIQQRETVVVDTNKMISPVPEMKNAGKEADIKPQTKATSKEELVKNSKYPEFIDHIWLRESGRGTNNNPVALHNKCKAKGMTNEFGFYPQGGWCWETFEQAVARLEKWRTQEAKSLTENQALCYYNSGVKTESCAYLGQNFALMN